jgi:hypothetical protein
MALVSVASSLEASSWRERPCGAAVLRLPSNVIVPAGFEDVEAAVSNRMWSAGAAAPEGSASTAIWCVVVACHGLGGNLGRKGGRVVGSY